MADIWFSYILPGLFILMGICILGMLEAVIAMIRGTSFAFERKSKPEKREPYYPGD